MNPECPADEELLALATDEPRAGVSLEHVKHCAGCQMRLKLLRGEIDELRSVSGQRSEALAKTVVPDVARESLPSGGTIGRYVIVSALGSGGQADVYRVIDPDLRRDLVLKLTRRPSSDRDAPGDALVAEGQLLAALDHPGLVRIFDVGLHDRRPYLVLDHVQGRNLEQSCDGRRPSTREAARLIAEVARVVAYAHGRGVVHGDITPRNILIDGAGRPRLIDFGLSQMEDAWGESPQPHGGTPGFLPPEIAGSAGKSKPAPPGDVFGLGAVLYWLLTGQPPFAAPTLVETIARTRRGDINFDALQRASVPRRIALACRHALATDPGQRPRAAVLAAELERASRPPITCRAAAVIAVASMAGIALLADWHALRVKDESPPPSVVHSIPQITVDGNRNLSNVLPLRTGDRISIACNISEGETAIMLWFNAGGDLRQGEPARDLADKVDRMVYPATHEDIVLESPEGTDLIFFCRGRPVSDAELLACFPMGKPPPVLPTQNFLELQRGQVSIRGPLESSAIPGEIHQVEGLMKDINRALLKHFDGVTGIAFPHHPARPAAKQAQ
jgi:serine/threonine protein kinase